MAHQWGCWPPQFREKMIRALGIGRTFDGLSEADMADVLRDLADEFNPSTGVEDPTLTDPPKPPGPT